jgi:glycosyltransferase involved in cell wall biosynthesis
MKVLHVIPSLSSTLGGPPQVALHLVQALRQSGVDAEIVTTNHNGAEPLDVPLYQRVTYSPGCQEDISVPVWFLPHSRPALKEFIFSAPLTRWLWSNLHHYDVLDHHYLFSYAPTCAGAIARFKNIPYTVRTMGQLTPWALAQSSSKKQVYTALVERHNLNCASAIHCTTSAEAEDVRSFGIQTPTITLPLGVESPMFQADAKAQLHQQYSISAEVPIVLFLSRLHYKKRPDLLLKALSQLRQTHQFHIVLAGAGETSYLNQLQELAVLLGIADRVSFPGLVTGAAKDLLLQGSDMFVLPSFSENFGIAVAEALVAGLPVVITPGVQIASEVAVAQAGVVVSGEVDTLAAAIAHLLTTPQLRHQLGENGKRLAKSQYNWQAIAQRLIPVYTEIAAQKKLCHDVQFNPSMKA